jgi:hypothetical protein
MHHEYSKNICTVTSSQETIQQNLQVSYTFYMTAFQKNENRPFLLTDVKIGAKTVFPDSIHSSPPPPPAGDK